MRGNLASSRPTAFGARSIPACAGEPIGVTRWRCNAMVYPRVCGGTFRRLRRRDSAAGLSPRVRGNRKTSADCRRPRGSIPACAGEPHVGQGRRAGQEVYPRVCGGTIGIAYWSEPGRDLSPRVRGNHLFVTGLALLARSIPACAGEPAARLSAPYMDMVYPRVCGGTQSIPTARRPCWGLSPRVRGNPLPPIPWPAAAGSIPACAGEPPCPAAPCPA